jgi:hypothetical protein
VFDDGRGRVRYDQTRGQIWRWVGVGSWYKSEDMAIDTRVIILLAYLFIIIWGNLFINPLVGIVTHSQFTHTLISCRLGANAPSLTRDLINRALIICIYSHNNFLLYYITPLRVL